MALPHLVRTPRENDESSANEIDRLPAAHGEIYPASRISVFLVFIRPQPSQPLLQQDDSRLPLGPSPPARDLCIRLWCARFLVAPQSPADAPLLSLVEPQ